MAGEPSSLTRYAYDFNTNKKLYFPSVRDYFDIGTKDSGFSSYVSTLLLGGGGFGAEIAKAFFDDKQSMRGVISSIVISYSSNYNKEYIIK